LPCRVVKTVHQIQHLNPTFDRGFAKAQCA
jgi:hypothetical protein